MIEVRSDHAPGDGKYPTLFILGGRS